MAHTIIFAVTLKLMECAKPYFLAILVILVIVLCIYAYILYGDIPIFRRTIGPKDQ